MPEQINTTTMPWGWTLVRHHDSTETADASCGSTVFWNDFIDQLRVDSFGYYDEPNCSANKFLKHVTLHIYSQRLPYPDAHIGGQVTYNMGNGYSKITAPYTDPNVYWFKAAMSHEFGHAYDNWMRMSSDPGLEGFRQWFQKEVTVGDILYSDSQSVYPWQQAGGTQRPWEKFADMWRVVFGSVGTRGNDETVTPGFEASSTKPYLRRLLQLAPEMCSCAGTYGGIKPGTMTGSSGGWLFQLNSGHWVSQTDYYVWWLWNGQSWDRWYPSYVRD